MAWGYPYKKKKPFSLMGYDDTMDATAGQRPKRPWQDSVMQPAAKRSMIQGTTAALKDKPGWEEYAEVMGEMQRMEPEYIGGGSQGRDQPFQATPFAFNEEGLERIKKRKRLYPFL